MESFSHEFGQESYCMRASGVLKFCFHSAGGWRLLLKHSGNNESAKKQSCVPAALCDIDCHLVTCWGDTCGDCAVPAREQRCATDHPALEQEPACSDTAVPVPRAWKGLGGTGLFSATFGGFCTRSCLVRREVPVGLVIYL